MRNELAKVRGDRTGVAKVRAGDRTGVAQFRAGGAPTEVVKLRVAAVAKAQWGVIGSSQLADLGVSRPRASRWIAGGYLHPIHPGVYAVGHTSAPVEGRAIAGLLHTGPGAVLSHGTAAWWWGLVDDAPTLIEISTLARRASRPGLKVYGRHRGQSTRRRRLPVSTVPQLLLDVAASEGFDRARRLLAEADYRGLLDVEAVADVLGRGKPGSGALRRALRRHLPDLAVTRSPLEERFLLLCEEAQLPPPEVNVSVCGLMSTRSGAANG